MIFSGFYFKVFNGCPLKKELVYEEQRLIQQAQTTFDSVFAVVLLLNAVKLGVDVELQPPELRDLSPKSFASEAPWQLMRSYLREI